MNYEMRLVEFEDTLPLLELLHPGREHKKYAKMVYKDKGAKWTLSENELNIAEYIVKRSIGEKKDFKPVWE